VGALMIVASGLVHGMWTGRWGRSAEMAAAVERMGNLPEQIGPWKGVPEDQDQATLTMAGAVGHWTRRFTNLYTGDDVLVILLCGRPGQMTVHRPEHCYLSAGFAMTTPPGRYRLPSWRGAKGGAEMPVELWTAPFAKEEADGTVQLRIFWSWLGSSGWEATESPRRTFALEKVLYKLYVIRSEGPQPPQPEDPSVVFLKQLMPELNRHLIP
jgi:hypothetical protein